MTDEAVREYLSKLGKKGAASLNGRLTPAQRKRSAKKAATARWAKEREESKALKQRASELLSRAQARAPRSKTKKET